jgi:hypothetical protein
MHRNQGQNARLIGRCAQGGICNQILVTDHSEQAGECGGGERRPPPKEPTICIRLWLSGIRLLGRRGVRGERWQLDPGFVYKGGARTKIDSAIGTIEKVRFERIALIGSQLTKEVSLRGHLLYCLAMIHCSFPGAAVLV